jgi:methylaspartate ammonia-lyase
MTHIKRVLAVPATGAYYATDLAALQENPIPLGEQYTARPVTQGFRRVREVAEAVSVGLMLDDGRITWGDCVAVAYSGKAGRDPVFRTADGLSTIRNRITPVLEGRELTSFRELASDVEALTRETKVAVPRASDTERAAEDKAAGEGVSRRDLLTAPLRFLRSAADEGESLQAEQPTEYTTVERPLHTAIRYGVSQALLRAVALARSVTMAELIAEEWGLSQPDHPVPIHAQSGAQRRKNADKMIARGVDSLPHALVENIPRQLGQDGQQLVRYVHWLKARIEALRGPDYRPAIHLDVHGALGRIYDHNLGRILGYLCRLESSVQPYKLRLESPVIMKTRADQIEALVTLREYIKFRDVKVDLVADEWANTLDDIRAFVEAQAADMIQIKMPDLGGVQNSVEAVLTCKEGDVGAFLGGSCAETDLSARAAAHVAMATQPEMMMAKPGMGVDEAVSLVKNEMTRTLVAIKMRDA